MKIYLPSRSPLKSALKSSSASPQSSTNFDGPSDRPNDLSNATSSLDLNDKARIAFEDYSYELDSQFPSPPPVNLAIPLHRQSRSLSPLRLPPKPLSRIQSRRDLASPHFQTYRPSYSSYEDSTAVPVQKFYGPIVDSKTSLSAQCRILYPDTPPTSVTSSEYKRATPDMAWTVAGDPSQPNHPDHLAFLLSTVRITPASVYENKLGLQEHNTRNLSNESLPTVLHHNRNQSYSDHDDIASVHTISLDGAIDETGDSDEAHIDHAKTHPWSDSNDEGISYPYQAHHPQAPDHGKSTFLRDIFDGSELERKYCDTAVDYESEGRAYMEGLIRQRKISRHQIGHAAV